MNILLTGASGFVGNALCERLRAKPELSLAAALRSPRASLSGVTHQVVGDICGVTDWSLSLKGQHVVVHAAGRAHVMKNDVPDPLTEYRRVNVDGTLHLARQAVAYGVKRFIFISSIGVNGNTNMVPFTASSPANPA